MKRLILIIVNIVVVLAAIGSTLFVLHKINFDKGNKLYSKGQYEAALKAYNNAKMFSFRDTKVLHVLAKTHVKLGEYDEAIFWYKKIVAINPNDLDAYKMLGAISGFQAVFDEDDAALRQAYEYLKKAYESAPDKFGDDDKKIMQDFQKEIEDKKVEEQKTVQ